MTAQKSYVGMALCFYCLEPKELLLNNRLRPTIPDQACYDKEPCDQCRAYMQQGVILISVKAGSDKNNPYRTGGWVVIKEEAASNIFGDDVLKARVAFVEDEAWDKLGLPRGEA